MIFGRASKLNKRNAKISFFSIHAVLSTAMYSDEDSDESWDSTQESSEPYSPNRSTHDLSSLTSSFINIDLDPTSPRKLGSTSDLRDSGSSQTSNRSSNSTSSLSTVSLNGSTEPIGTGSEDKGLDLDQEPKTDSDLTKSNESNTEEDQQKNNNENNTSEGDDTNIKEDIKPEITIVPADQVQKSSSNETLKKSAPTEDNDSINNSGHINNNLNTSNGDLKPNLEPASLSPERLAPKMIYEMVKMSQPFKSYVTQVRFQRGSNTLVTCTSNDGNLMLYDCATNEVKFTLNGHKSGIVDFDWSFNNDYLLTCGKDNIIRLWNVAQQKKITSYKLGTGINCIRFHPMNNNQFIIGDAKGSVHVNNISNARSVVLEFPPREEEGSDDDSYSGDEEQPVTHSISTIEVGDDGYLLTGDCVGQMRVYKSLPPEFNFTLMKSKKLNINCPLTNFIMDTDKKTVWINANDNQLKLLSYSNLEPFKVSFFNQTYTLTGGMSKSGLVASLVHGSRTVTLVSPDTSQVVDELQGPNEIVNQADIAPDAKYVVAGTIKGSIVVWELTAQEIKPHSPSKRRRSIPPDFQTLVNTVNSSLS